MRALLWQVQFMDHLTLPHLTQCSGALTLPGSKSLSNRLLLMAALAEGETHLHNLLQSDDTQHMLNALTQLGVQIQNEGAIYRVLGLGTAFKTVQPQRLFLGNAGTAMRPLTAVLSAGFGTYELTGIARMYERPIGHLVDALKQQGADIEALGEPGFPPLRIVARGLAGGEVSVTGHISSQFLTALLMAAPLAQQQTTLSVAGELVSRPYIDITLALLKQFGIVVQEPELNQFVIPAAQTYLSPGEIWVEGDASSASYFLAAAAIAGGPVRVHGIGRASVQGDARFAEVLGQMGAQVSWSEHWVEVSRGTLNGIDVDLNAIPDAAMTIAVTALFAKGPTRIRNIANWRVKETDRLAAMQNELTKLGAQVSTGEDWIEIHPAAQLTDATIETYDDHRIAMCFSLAAFSDATITILDPGCTAKTYPQYFDDFFRLCAVSL